jgi:hypothetical protein
VWPCRVAASLAPFGSLSLGSPSCCCRVAPNSGRPCVYLGTYMHASHMCQAPMNSPHPRAPQGFRAQEYWRTRQRLRRAVMAVQVVFACCLCAFVFGCVHRHACTSMPMKMRCRVMSFVCGFVQQGSPRRFRSVPVCTTVVWMSVMCVCHCVLLIVFLCISCFLPGDLHLQTPLGNHNSNEGQCFAKVIPSGPDHGLAACVHTY